jgi:hypothetical protein
MLLSFESQSITCLEKRFFNIPAKKTPVLAYSFKTAEKQS